MTDRLRRGPTRALCLLVLLVASGLLHAAPRIGILTMGPGAEYWSRFGHNAVLVELADGQRISYNYGYFDFEQPGFLTRFLRGRMLYRLLALPYERDRAIYADEGRSMVLQWLDLDPTQAQSVADYLAWNARAENADYRYDYFSDNCSTKVRDVIDRALGGELKRQTHGRSRGLTLRSESLRLSAPDAWMYFGIHLLLAEPTDRPLSRWEESFVPQRLHDALALVRLADGRPLVVAEEAILPQRIAPARSEEPRFALPALIAGLLLAGCALWGRRASRLARLARAGLAAYWLFATLAAALMLLLWAGTDHAAAWANRNLLLLPPTSLLLLLALAAAARGEAPRWARHLARLHLLGWFAALMAYFLSVRDQDTFEWILLSGPLHFAALRLFAPAAEADAAA